METKILPIRDIHVEESRYRFMQKTMFDEADLRVKSIWASLSKVGVISPVIVFEDENQEYHLVDGFCRCAFVARDDGKLPCAVIATTEQVFDYILSEYFDRIVRSVAMKSQFVKILLRDISRSVVISEFLPMIELDPHETVLKKVEAVGGLPAHVLEFCDEKSFSLKQCENLTHFQKDLLLELFSWKTNIALTASIIDELGASLRDYCRTNKCKVSSFVEKGGIKEVFEMNLSPQEKTKRVRELVKNSRYPILTKMNAGLEDIRASMKLPKNVDLKWDRTLEAKELAVTIRIKNESDWSTTLSTLSGETKEKGLARMLEQF